MKRMVVAVAVALVSVAVAGSGTGLGVIVGEPTGVSAKFWLSENMAVDAAAAWSVSRHTALHVHADMLYHNADLLKVPVGELPAYVGIGGRFKLAGREEGQPVVGVRVPLGLEYLFEPVPIGVFFEVVPVLNVLPRTEFDVNGGLGGRWYFR